MSSADLTNPFSFLIELLRVVLDACSCGSVLTVAACSLEQVPRQRRRIQASFWSQGLHCCVRPSGCPASAQGYTTTLYTTLDKAPCGHDNGSVTCSYLHAIQSYQQSEVCLLVLHQLPAVPCLQQPFDCRNLKQDHASGLNPYSTVEKNFVTCPSWDL